MSTSSLRLGIMTPFLPDVRKRTSGVSSPESPTERLGYNCAYPSWPNRPCLDSRSSSTSSVPSVASSAVTSAPAPILDADFMEKLRRMPRPDECFEDDSDFEEDDNDDELPATMGPACFSSANASFGARSPVPATPPQNCSLLSRALSARRNPSSSAARCSIGGT